MTILTPIRRRLTLAARRQLYALASAWHDGSTGTNAMIGLGIQRGMIYRRLCEIAAHADAIPRGVITVLPRGPNEGPITGVVDGFDVDLDEISARLAAGRCRPKLRQHPAE